MNFGSGPYSLPVDYLRTSGSSGSTGASRSAWWTLLGVPYMMIPCDLAEFDIQVQQAGLQSYPWLWATDMSPFGIISVQDGNTHSNTTLDGLTTTAGFVVGQGVAGPGIVPGSTIAAIPGGGTSVTLSAAATSTGAGAFMFGNQPLGYAYPPPSGSYPVSIRYQRLMPPLPLDVTGNLTAGAQATIPWFPNTRYLLKKLAGMLMEQTDDDRAPLFIGEGSPQSPGADAILAKYLKMKDDDTNRAKTVQLDRRRFGQGRWSDLKNTKVLGW